MITRKQVKVEKNKVGDYFEATAKTTVGSLVRGYGCTEEEALQSLADNLSFYQIEHALEGVKYLGGDVYSDGQNPKAEVC